MATDDRVVLSLEARPRFPDIGTRSGTVKMVGNAVAVMFDGMKILTWFPEQALELVG